MKFSRPMLVATFLLILLHRCLLVTSDQCENGTEFGYKEGTKNGPESWAKICSGWETCGNGMAQSPINIIHEEAHHCQDLGGLDQTYKPTNAVLVNRGHDIMVKWADGAGAIFVEGTEFFLKQMHWHSPSEHAIDNTRFILEGHMVHQSSDEKLAAIGFFYKSGQPDPFISKLMGPIQAIAHKKGAETELGMVDPTDVKAWRKRYYRYNGSLSSPPCTEGVIWTVMRKVGYVSPEQVKVLTEAVLEENKMNARPVQPINGRQIQMYNP